MVLGLLALGMVIGILLIARTDKKKAELTAVTEGALDQQDESTAFALETLTKSRIMIVAVTEMDRIAKLARKELRI